MFMLLAGTFPKLSPELDMICIGPDLKDVYSLKIALYLDSVPKTRNLLLEILLRLK